MTRLNVSAIARTGCLAVTLCFIPIAEAQKKPSKPPGGGGAAYRIVPFDAGSPLSTTSKILAESFHKLRQLCGATTH